jgi:hypothetical protein
VYRQAGHEVVGVGQQSVDRVQYAHVTRYQFQVDDLARKVAAGLPEQQVHRRAARHRADRPQRQREAVRLQRRAEHDMVRNPAGPAVPIAAEQVDAQSHAGRVQPGLGEHSGLGHRHDLEPGLVPGRQQHRVRPLRRVPVPVLGQQRVPGCGAAVQDADRGALVRSGAVQQLGAAVHRVHVLDADPGTLGDAIEHRRDPGHVLPRRVAESGAGSPYRRRGQTRTVGEPAHVGVDVRGDEISGALAVGRPALGRRALDGDQR